MNKMTETILGFLVVFYTAAALTPAIIILISSDIWGIIVLLGCLSVIIWITYNVSNEETREVRKKNTTSPKKELIDYFVKRVDKREG